MADKTLMWMLLVLTMMPVSLTENRDDWIDPNDMLNFDPSTNTMKKNKIQLQNLPTSTPEPQQSPEENSENCPPCESCPPCMDCPPCPECKLEQIEDRACVKPDTCPQCKCDPPKECVSEQATLPLLRQYIKTLLTHLGDKAPVGGNEDFIIHVSLSADSVKLLDEFVSDGKQKHIHDVHEILTSMIDKVWSNKLGKLEKMIQWMENKIGLKLERIMQFFVVGALASLMLLIEIRLQIAWRRRVSQLIVLMFVISIPWTWVELYKHAEIKQQSMASRKIPKECESGEQDYWTAMKSYFTLQDDKCHEYHEHLLIDPLLKVPPTKAIAVTFVRFFVAPLKDVGGAMSEFIRALLIDLPVTLYPVAIAIVGLFLFMFLFMWFGYSIRLPFFLTIERSPQLSVADSQLHQAIQDNSQQTLSQLEQLQARLESTESQIADRLQNLQQVQQAAIEYTMSSSAQASPASSPSLSRLEVKDSPPRSTRSGLKKRSEVKVTAAADFNGAEGIGMSSPPYDSPDSKGVQDILDRGEPDTNSTNISSDTKKLNVTKNRNENSVKNTSVNEVDKNSESTARRCVSDDIDTLKPDGTRD